MTRHRYVPWVFVAAILLMLAAPWMLPHQTWAALLGPQFNWQKGVVLLAFAGMAAAYAYWLVELVGWVRSLSFKAHRDPRRFVGDDAWTARNIPEANLRAHSRNTDPP